jgi:hypothetical protein
MTSSLISSRNAPAKATEQNAKASPDFAAKLAETQALLRNALRPNSLRSPKPPAWAPKTW